MDKHRIVIVIVVAIVLGLPLASQLMRRENAADQAPAYEGTRVPAQGTASPATTATPTQPPESASVVLQQAPVAVPQPQLTAQGLVGTVWSVQGATVQLLDGGRIMAQVPGVPMQIQGTWAVNGNTITVSAAGRSYSLLIAGQQILANGQPIQRVR